MAGVLLRLDDEGVRWINGRLGVIFAQYSKTQDLMEEIGEHLVTSTLLRMEEAVSPEGDPWAAWSDDYAAKREGGAMLMDTERLAGSITYRAETQRVEVGTNVIYGAIHQAGGEEVGMPIPARPYLGISSEDEIELMQLITDWGKKQLEAA